ncbi:hypothetical protein GJ496_003379 [Pomphorhynchus laevis]|nr:hypothetical protein GJ496_003379 [Pomphorhynchus laevis]
MLSRRSNSFCLNMSDISRGPCNFWLLHRALNIRNELPYSKVTADSRNSFKSMVAQWIKPHEMTKRLVDYLWIGLSS